MSKEKRIPKKGKNYVEREITMAMWIPYHYKLVPFYLIYFILCVLIMVLTLEE